MMTGTVCTVICTFLSPPAGMRGSFLTLGATTYTVCFLSSSRTSALELSQTQHYFIFYVLIMFSLHSG
jgi:hypothetical protein